MTKEEIENLIFQQLQFITISGLNKTEGVMNIMSLVDEYAKQEGMLFEAFVKKRFFGSDESLSFPKKGDLYNLFQTSRHEDNTPDLK